MRGPDIATASSYSAPACSGCLRLAAAALRVAAAACRAAGVAPRLGQQPRRHRRSTGGTREERVPLVIDASGNPDAPAMALNMLAHEGILLIASWFGTRPVVLPLGGAFTGGV